MVLQFSKCSPSAYFGEEDEQEQFASQFEYSPVRKLLPGSERHFFPIADEQNPLISQEEAKLFECKYYSSVENKDFFFDEESQHESLNDSVAEKFFELTSHHQDTLGYNDAHLPATGITEPNFLISNEMFASSIEHASSERQVSIEESISIEEYIPENVRKASKCKKRVPNVKKTIATKMKSYLNSLAFEVVDYVSDLIHDHFHPKAETIRVGRGRPRASKEITIAQLNAKIDKLFRELNLKISKTLKIGRTDALDIAIKRKICKIPDVFLKLIASKSHYKSKDLKVNLQAYMESFLKGYVKIFDVPVSGDIVQGSAEELQLIKHFFEYCILCFPKDRMCKLLKMLPNRVFEPILNDQSMIGQLEYARKTSLVCFRKLYSANVALRTICGNLHKFSAKLGAKEKRELRNTLDKIDN